MYKYVLFYDDKKNDQRSNKTNIKSHCLSTNFSDKAYVLKGIHSLFSNEFSQEKQGGTICDYIENLLSVDYMCVGVCVRVRVRLIDIYRECEICCFR